MSDPAYPAAAAPPADDGAAVAYPAAAAPADAAAPAAAAAAAPAAAAYPAADAAAPAAAPAAAAAAAAPQGDYYKTYRDQCKQQLETLAQHEAAGSVDAAQIKAQRDQIEAYMLQLDAAEASAAAGGQPAAGQQQQQQQQSPQDQQAYAAYYAQYYQGQQQPQGGHHGQPAAHGGAAAAPVQQPSTEGKVHGVVTRWLSEKMYGFIKTDGEHGDVFAHHRNILGSEQNSRGELIEGQEVWCDVVPDQKSNKMSAVAIFGPGARLLGSGRAADGRLNGRVVKWHADKGYGFIRTDEGDLFCHTKNINGGSLVEGAEVSAEMSISPQGKRVAQNVTGPGLNPAGQMPMDYGGGGGGGGGYGGHGGQQGGYGAPAPQYGGGGGGGGGGYGAPPQHQQQQQQPSYSHQAPSSGYDQARGAPSGADTVHASRMAGDVHPSRMGGGDVHPSRMSGGGGGGGRSEGYGDVHPSRGGGGGGDVHPSRMGGGGGGGGGGDRYPPRGGDDRRGGDYGRDRDYNRHDAGMCTAAATQVATRMSA